MTPLAPNLADISRHLYELFSPEFVQAYPDAWIEIAYGHPDIRDGAVDGAQCWSAFELDKAAAFAAARSSAGYNIYCGVALRQGRQPRDGRAKDDSALTSAFAWSEYDGDGDDARIDAILKDKRIVPAIVVTTGTAPHPRRHLYFKLAGKPTPDDLLAINTRLVKLLGTDAVQNASRVMRLAGTISYPSAKKQARGYVAELVTLHVVAEARAYTIEQLMADDTNSTGKTTGGIDWTIVEQHAGWLNSSDDLPTGFSRKGRMIVAHSGNLGDLKFDLEQQKLVTKPYKSWSEVSFALAAIFKTDGRFSQEQIAAALMCPLVCNGHIVQIKDEAIRRRAVERMILRSHTPPQQAIKHSTSEPDWRERRENGSPVPSMQNARLALDALGITCSLDTFHSRMLIDSADKGIVGAVDDNVIMTLRRIMSDQYGFDLREQHVRDAVISRALENQFDPVCDMLADAEKNWDKVARLDRMAADYLSCEDTALNAMFVRKMMIAAVARARSPGCKFDTIGVFESAEGFNKSTAWKALAGEDNFSDEAIIGKATREVQEQLAACWVHENSELHGMKRADIEHIKAFASRTSDDARPAYGHFLKKQPRHSIEVGTTNSSQYLQSQTGNRRFWPMVVLKSIEVELLRRDRLQLWGEAAHYQSARESLVLPESMWADAGVEQDARRIDDPWEEGLRDLGPEVVVKYLDKATGAVVERTITITFNFFDENPPQTRVDAAVIFDHVLRIPFERQTTAVSMRLSTVMKKLGWSRTRNGYLTIGGRQVRGYFKPLPKAAF